MQKEVTFKASVYNNCCPTIYEPFAQFNKAMKSALQFKRDKV